MEGNRILIVGAQQQARAALAEYLRQQEEIAVVKEATNGVDALKMLSQEEFDVMVTDVILPQMDGYALLSEMQRTPLAGRPRVIVTSALYRDDFVTRAIELGASYYIVKPYDARHLLNHIRALFGEPVAGREALSLQDVRCVQNLDERLGSLFLTIGIPAHIKGYQFLRQAVKMVADEPELIGRITKELYPRVARQYGATASKVERAMRHAIEVAWNRGRVETLNALFGCEVCSSREKPTNGEFIAMLADRLSMERSA